MHSRQDLGVNAMPHMNVSHLYLAEGYYRTWSTVASVAREKVRAVTFWKHYQDLGECSMARGPRVIS